MMSMSSERPVILASRRKAGPWRQQPGQVAGAVADDGERFLCSREVKTSCRADPSGTTSPLSGSITRVEMVFPDDRAVLGFDAFAGNAWGRSPGKAVEIHSVDAERVSSSPCMPSPQGSAPKQPIRRLQLAGSRPLRTNSSAMLRAWDGVATIMVGRKSRMS